MVFSNLCLRSLSEATQGSAYLLTQRSWTSRIGTGFRKWSFSRPRRRVTTRPASSSTRRCFITPKRVIGRRPSSAVSVCPSSANSSSRRPRRVGAAIALNTSSTPERIGDRMVTCQADRLADVSDQAASGIARGYPDRIEVRGRDLTGDLMGRLSFTEYFHLLLTGAEPTEDQRYFLDLLLVAIAEHGLMPTNVAARMTLAADPGSLQGAVAAGILGCGPVILGTAQDCANLLEQARAKVEAGADPAEVGAEVAREVHAAGGKLPGFGHPVHKPLDPRAERILELADARGVSGPYVALARRFRDAAAEAWGRPLTLNVSLPIAAVMLDLGFPAAAVKAVPILARTASLLAHLAEEQREPVGFLMAGEAEHAIRYER